MFALHCIIFGKRFRQKKKLRYNVKIVPRTQNPHPTNFHRFPPRPFFPRPPTLFPSKLLEVDGWTLRPSSHFNQHRCRLVPTGMQMAGPRVALASAPSQGAARPVIHSLPGWDRGVQGWPSGGCPPSSSQEITCLADDFVLLWFSLCKTKMSALTSETGSCWTKRTYVLTGAWVQLNLLRGTIFVLSRSRSLPRWQMESWKDRERLDE